MIRSGKELLLVAFGTTGEMLTGGIPGSWTLVIGGRFGNPGNDTPDVDVKPTIKMLYPRSLTHYHH